MRLLITLISNRSPCVYFELLSAPKYLEGSLTLFPLISGPGTAPPAATTERLNPSGAMFTLVRWRFPIGPTAALVAVASRRIARVV